MIGTRIGPFVVKDKLGEGGMGAVFLAEHTVLDTTRVIKLLLPELTRNQTVVQRFINEARAAAAIQHRNIIAVHDVGQLPGGDWYIVMDHLPGGTLRALLAASGGPLAPELALELIAQIANGLDAAHARGVIHRDLKPDNILVTPRDGNERHVVILDFGVAKLNEQLAGSLTLTGQAIGTPAFMPPEQLRGAKVDATCDVFALGVIAYQLITGGYLPYQDLCVPEPGYASLPAAEIYHRQISGAAVDPRQRIGSVPDGWARAILTALEREPAARPATAGAFALALAEATPDGAAIVRAVAPELFEARREGRATVVATAHAVAPSTLGAAAGQSLAQPRARPRAFWPVPVACALVTSLATLGVMLQLRGPAAAPPRPPAAPPSIVTAAPIALPPPLPPSPRRVALEPPPPDPPPVVPKRRVVVATGTITVKVSPWAMVTIDGVAWGQTPLTASVAAGRHRVRIANDATGKTETLTVDVDPAQAVRIERSFSP
jgi:tRNA A-37 threonylcarbamoyl transferase component Bud32